MKNYKIQAPMHSHWLLLPWIRLVTRVLL